MYNSPNDMEWQAQLGPLGRQNTQTFIGEIIDARTDGNYTDTLTQQWSVRLVGWGTEIYNCKTIVPHGAYNGSGEYNTYKKGDVVMLVAREGQMEELLIMGSVRLNGDLKKLETEGKGLKYGEMPIGSSGNPVPANQVSLHPARVTKLDGYTKVYGTNNIADAYTNPTIGGTLEERQNNQPIPGVYQSVNAEGVFTTYAYGGIVHYTDGNLVFVSNGSKQNKCTRFLEQAKRHSQIAAQLKTLAVFSPANVLGLADAIENGEASIDINTGQINTDGQPLNNEEEENIDISSNTPLQDPTTGQASTTTNPPNIKADEEALPTPPDGITINTDLFNATKNSTEGDEIRSTLYRAKKHEELARLAKETADDCNQNYAAYHQQADLMASTVGNHFGNGGAETSEDITTSEPNQFFGNVSNENYSSRNAGVPKPPVISTPAHTNNYDAKREKGEHLPIKRIFLHNTVYNLQSTIATFQSSTSDVSAHYTVARDGKIHQHVPDNYRAYHSGELGNGNSIGIEFVATKTERGFTEAQEQSGIKLIKYLVDIYDVPKNKIAGHRTVYDTECPSLIFPTENDLKNWVNANI